MDRDEWVINGSKSWITNIPVADFFTVLSQDGESDHRHPGFTPDDLQGRCEMVDGGERPLNKGSMAKYFASEIACRASYKATRIVGVYSYSMEYDVRKFYKTCRFLLFGGGTSEILQKIISRECGVF